MITKSILGDKRFQNNVFHPTIDGLNDKNEKPHQNLTSEQKFTVNLCRSNLNSGNFVLNAVSLWQLFTFCFSCTYFFAA